MESVGTLPCAPEIPDCVEQVREGGLGPTSLGSNGGTSAAHLAPRPFWVFLPWLHLFNVWGAQSLL